MLDFVAFRCLVAGSIDLCIRGKCVAVPGEPQYCECEPGFGPDLFTYHNYNCAVPHYAFEIFFVLNFLLWLGVLISFTQRVFLRPRKRQEDAILKRISKQALVIHLTTQCILVGYLVQGGMFEISAFFTFVFFFLLSVIVAEFLALVLNIAHHNNRAMDSFVLEMRKVLNFSLALYTFLGVCNVYMIRTVYADVFTSISSLAFSLVLASLAAVVRKHSNEFVSVLEIGIRFSKDRVAMERLKARVMRIQKYMGVHVLSAVVAMLVALTIRAVLGTVPMYYIMLFPCILGENLLPLAVAELFEGKELDMQVVSKQDKFIEFDSHVASEREGESTCSESSAHSGYIVGNYVVNTSRNKRAARRKRD